MVYNSSKLSFDFLNIFGKVLLIILTSLSLKPHGDKGQINFKSILCGNKNLETSLYLKLEKLSLIKHFDASSSGK